jgi:hypothetical protein
VAPSGNAAPLCHWAARALFGVKIILCLCLTNLARQAVTGCLHLTDSLALTPLVQIIADPAENPRDDLFVLAGLRAVYAF